MSQSVKVKTLADKFGLASKDVLKELEALGVTGVKAAMSNIPEEAVPAITAQLEKITKKAASKAKAPAKKSSSNGAKAAPKAEKAKAAKTSPAKADAKKAKAVKAAPAPKAEEKKAKAVQEKPATKPAPAPVAKSAPAPVAKPAEKPASAPAAKPVTPVVKAVPPPAPKPAPAPAPVVKPAAKPAPAPVVNRPAPVQKPFQRPDNNFGRNDFRRNDQKQNFGKHGNDRRDDRFNGKKDHRHDDRHDFKGNQISAPQTPANDDEIREITISGPVIVKALAEALGRKVNEVITKLMMMNVLASINQTIDDEVAVKVAEQMNVILTIEKGGGKASQNGASPVQEKIAPEDVVYEEDKKDLRPRPPIVTFMGHVDHGKTSLQDYIRKSRVAASEAGGITQNIGASVVSAAGKTITFIDTPGHEAFTQMRARGANVTDIVVLVVAADDGFMPQTIEAMNHAKAAKVPIVVAINKMDLPNANPDKVLLNMQQNDLMSEDWGGQVAAIRVSARTGAGIDDLLERILLEAEMLELAANPKRPGMAYVLESQLEQGLGPTASVVVKNGTLRVGDTVICGEHYGKIKTLIDSRGHRVAMAGPSTPVKVVGLSGVPEAGAKMAVCQSMVEARELAEARSASNRLENLSNKTTGTSLEDLFSQMEEGKRNNLKVIVKADVRGSSEAIVESLKKLPHDKISVEPIHVGVGAITENDVLLAASSNAIVVGFHVRVNPGVNDLAKKEKVEIRLYSIIYELLEDITDALAGRLEPEKREKDIGTVKILKIFTLSKGPKICGCRVEKGIAKVGAKARVFRNNELIFNGEVRSLRHFQDDVKEVHAGMECGIRLDNFMDFTEGDYINLYEIELKKATL